MCRLGVLLILQDRWRLINLPACSDTVVRWP